LAEDKGGAIYNEGTMTLNGALLFDNKADSGSAIYNKGTLTDSDSLFYRNHASAGTIFNLGSMVMNESEISKNIAEIDGGAISNSGSLTINGGEITKNSALKGDGGAINTVGTCDPLGRACMAKLDLNGTVICYNSAYDCGGAIYSAGITNLASNKRAKIFGNKALFGGGIFVVNSLGVNGALIHNKTAVVSTSDVGEA
jgi:predicted outer membrane repeat protein